MGVLIYVIFSFLLLSCNQEKGRLFGEKKVGSPRVALEFANQDPLVFPDTVALGSSSDEVVILQAEGGVRITEISGSVTAPFEFKGGSFPGYGGTCAEQITASSCTLVLSFAPTATRGLLTGTVTITYSNNIFLPTITKSLEGLTATDLSVSDGPSYNFGGTLPGLSLTKTFTLTHQGGDSATGISVAMSSSHFTFLGGAYPGTGGTCGTTLSSGSCTFVVSFTPDSITSFTSQLTVSFNDGVQSQQKIQTLTGTGDPPAVLSISDSPFYDFGTLVQFATADHTFTITHSGSVAATSMSGSGLGSFFSFKGGSYPGTGGTCGTTLTSGTCTVVVRYNPTSAGSHSASMNINYNNGVSSQSVTRAVQGVAVAEAILSVGSGQIDFGNVITGNSADATITMTYVSGAVPATSISEISLAAPFAFKGGFFPGTGGNCNTSMSSGTCTFVVSFSPIALGSQSATFRIFYHTGSRFLTISRPLIGTGVSSFAVVSQNSGSLDNWFETQLNPIYITNNLDQTFQPVSMEDLPAPFDFGLSNTFNHTISFPWSQFFSEGIVRLPNRNFLIGEKAGSYFGYSVATFQNQKDLKVAISAPLFDFPVGEDRQGKVYFFGSNQNQTLGTLKGFEGVKNFGLGLYPIEEKGGSSIIVRAKLKDDSDIFYLFDLSTFKTTRSWRAKEDLRNSLAKDYQINFDKIPNALQQK